MRLMLDTCVWGGALADLTAAGHDTIWTGDWETDPGDRAILKSAYEQDRILVTLDKDFGERAIVYGEPHCGIIRLVNIPARQQGLYCLQVLRKYAEDLDRKAIVTVEKNRVRVRLAD